MNNEVLFCKEYATSGMAAFLKAFDYVPDDKLTWTPTPSAKSAVRIAAHTALYAARFARMLREYKLPSSDGLAAWIAQRNAEEIALANRADIEATFREGTEEVLAALDALSPDAIASTLDSGLGWSVPMTWLMSLPGRHALLHAGQIDYLQTCWDDQEVHF